MWVSINAWACACRCRRLVRVGIDKCVDVGICVDVGVGVCESVGVKEWSSEEIRRVAWA